MEKLDIAINLLSDKNCENCYKQLTCNFIKKENYTCEDWQTIEDRDSYLNQLYSINNNIYSEVNKQFQSNLYSKELTKKDFLLIENEIYKIIDKNSNNFIFDRKVSIIEDYYCYIISIIIKFSPVQDHYQISVKVVK